MESNEQTELTKKMQTDSQIESGMVASGGVEELSKKEKVLQTGPGGFGVPQSLWILCPPPGTWKYGSQCQSLVKRNYLFESYTGLA